MITSSIGCKHLFFVLVRTNVCLIVMMPSRLQGQAAETAAFPRSDVPIELCTDTPMARSSAIAVRYHTPEEEIAFGPACWMWDYLRRSGRSPPVLQPVLPCCSVTSCAAA